MLKLRHLLAATTGLALLASASTAHATAYAYGNINFTNLTLSNLQAPGVTLNSANVTTRDSAGFPGAAAASNSVGPANAANPLTAGSDVPQAFSGPGPFPGENNYGQALLNSFGTRGDAQLVGNLLTGVGTGANDVAEGRIGTAGSASSTAGTSTGFNVVLSTGTTQTFTLAFNASDSVIATTTAANEIASATVSASFTVAGTAGTVFATQVYSPDSLNVSGTSTGGNGNFNTTNASSPFSFSVTLNPGTYQFSLLSGAQEQVTAPTPTPPNPVPEPASMALLGAGLAAIGLVRRRRA